MFVVVQNLSKAIMDQCKYFTLLRSIRLNQRKVIGNSEEQISEHTQTYLYRTYRFFEKEKLERNITECSPRVEGLVCSDRLVFDR